MSRLNFSCDSHLYVASSFALPYRNFTVRAWQPDDLDAAARTIRQALAEYGLPWEPEGADRDAIAVETHYQQTGGEFWVVETNEAAGIDTSKGESSKVVGTAAYRPINRKLGNRNDRAVEIRKMYLQPSVRGLGLGRFLLQQLEERIRDRGFQTIWLETASVLEEAVRLYERNGYQPATDVETPRCDRVYMKSLR